MKRLFGLLEKWLNSRTKDEEMDVLADDIKEYKLLDKTDVDIDSYKLKQYKDLNRVFKRKVKIYNVYGRASIIGQILNFSNNFCDIVLTGNVVTSVISIKLDGETIKLSDIGVKTKYVYKEVQGHLCYCLKVEAPHIKIYSRLEFDIYVDLNLKQLLGDRKGLLDNKLAFEQSHGMVVEPDINVDDILYYLSLYFGDDKVYKKRKHVLNIQDFDIWRVERKIVNVQCHYVNLEGYNTNYTTVKDIGVKRNIYLPFICDEKKIIEIINRLAEEQYTIILIMPIDRIIHLFDDLTIVIGCLQYYCCVTKVEIFEDKEDEYKQKIVAKIMGDANYS